MVRWIWAQWQAIHEESLEVAPQAQAGSGKKGSVIARPRLDWKPAVVLVVVALSLTVQEYWGDRNVFARLTEKGYFTISPRWWELWSFVWWTGWRVVGYLLVPMIVVLLLPGERLRDYGWSFKGFTKHFKIYVILFALVLPLVVLMSRTEGMRDIYPFYRNANRSTFDLVSWEVLYALQFLSLEFFFRGFMLHALKRAMGAHAIWVMIVPYCMIHYGKTMSETVGAIFAGLILGTVALRTKSIWGGVLIHVGVALTMDLLTIAQCPKGAPCPR